MAVAVSTGRFYADLAKSEDAVLVIATWLADLGKEVYKPPPANGPDSGDLYIGKQRIEVKQRTFDFTDKRYPYGDVMVCEARRIIEAKPEVYITFNVSKDLRWAVSTYTKTINKWRIKRQWDHRYERWGYYLHAPFSVCTFHDIRL